ncbi:MAG: hypothetical protein IAE79_15065 [Anaerolinea sp.]|nr:hypothetical protein [Anaerolinea sp.]
MMKQDFLTQEEASMAQMVRATLHVATQPAPGQLAALMPAPPVRKATAVPLWRQQWATLATCVFLLLGSVGLYYARQQHDAFAPAAPTLLAATATMTQEPTSTLARQGDGAVLPLRATAVATQPAFAPTHVMPSPNPTPIAALMPALSSN